MVRSLKRLSQQRAFYFLYVHRFIDNNARPGFHRVFLCVSVPAPGCFVKVHRKTSSKVALKFVDRKGLSKKDEKLIMMEVIEV